MRDEEHFCLCCLAYPEDIFRIGCAGMVFVTGDVLPWLRGHATLGSKSEAHLRPLADKALSTQATKPPALPRGRLRRLDLLRLVDWAEMHLACHFGCHLAQVMHTSQRANPAERGTSPSRRAAAPRSCRLPHSSAVVGSLADLPPPPPPRLPH